MMLKLFSESSITLNTSAITPILYRSSASGSSLCVSFWHTIPIYLVFLPRDLTNLIVFSLPTEIGRLEPGNTTVLRNGNIGSSSGSKSKSISRLPSIKSPAINDITFGSFSCNFSVCNLVSGILVFFNHKVCIRLLHSVLLFKIDAEVFNINGKLTMFVYIFYFSFAILMSKFRAKLLISIQLCQIFFFDLNNLQFFNNIVP